MNSSPKVSIVTICRNCVSEIEETLRSVISQDYDNKEYIVIDGASTDGTTEIIKNYLNYIDIFVSEADTGVYNAMNKGVQYATGDWCLFMNGGDRFVSDDVIRRMFYNRNPSMKTKVYFGNTWERYKNGQSVLLRAMPVWPTITRCQPYVHQSAFFNIVEKKKPFYNEKYRIVSDYNTSLWYFRKYGKKSFEYVDVTVSSYKNYDGISSIKENQRKIAQEFLRVWIHYPICWSRYIKEVVKYFIIFVQPFKRLRKKMLEFNSKKIIENKNSRTLE